MNSGGIDFDRFLDDFETELSGVRNTKLQKLREEHDDLNAFQKGLAGGFENTKAMGHGFLGLAKSAVGDKAGANQSFRESFRHTKEAGTYHQRVDRLFSTDDESGGLGSLGNFGSWAAAKTGELVPFMAEVALSGAVGATAGSQVVPGIGPDDAVAAPGGAVGGMAVRLFKKRAIKELLEESAERYVRQGLSKKAAQEAAEGFVRDNASRLLLQAMKTVSKRWGANAGVIATSSVLESGGMWADGMQNGYDNPYSALGLGLLSGSSEVFLGNVPMGLRTFFKTPGVRQAVNKVARQKGPKVAAGFLWDVAKNMGEEGGQEVFQEFLGSLNAEINDPDFKITSKETFMQWAEAGAAGTLGGLVFGAPASVNNLISSRMNGEEQENAGSDSVDLLAADDSSVKFSPKDVGDYPAPEAFTPEQLMQLDEEREAVRDHDSDRANELDELYGQAFEARSAAEEADDFEAEVRELIRAGYSEEDAREAATPLSSDQEQALADLKQNDFQNYQALRAIHGDNQHAILREAQNPEAFNEGVPTIPPDPEFSAEHDEIGLDESQQMEKELLDSQELDTDTSALDNTIWYNPEGAARRKQSWLDQIQSDRMDKVLHDMGRAMKGVPPEFVKQHKATFDELEQALGKRQAGKVKEIANVLKKKARNAKRKAARKAKNASSVSQNTENESQQKLPVTDDSQSHINSSQIDTKATDPDTGEKKNPYMTMPFAVVKEHADTGVRLAKEAIEARKAELSDKKLEPSDNVVQKWFGGRKIYLKQSDLDGKRNLLPLYTAKGERKVGESIIRENVSSEKPAPYVVKDASGTVVGKRMQLPAAETIGHKSGKPFYIEQDGGETFTYGASPAAVEKIENPLSAANGQEVNTDPTDAQKEAENYKKAHVKIDGLDISIENPQGSIRRGKDAAGKEWKTEMKADYGYIRGTKGYDKDHVDVFIAPGYAGGADTVFIVNQVHGQKFDEHKVVLGAVNEAQAEKLYLSNYEKGWQGMGDIVSMSLTDFKEWVFSDAPAQGLAEESKTESVETELIDPLPTPTKNDLLDYTQFPGENYVAKPTHVGIQLRNLGLKPMFDGDPISEPYDGTQADAEDILKQMNLRRLIDEAGASFRESYIFATDSAGTTAWIFTIDPVTGKLSSVAYADVQRGRDALKKMREEEKQNQLPENKIDRSESAASNLAWWTAEGEKKLGALKSSKATVFRNDRGTGWVYSIGDGNTIPSPFSTKKATEPHAASERADAIKYLESGAWARANSEADWRGFEETKNETASKKIPESVTAVTGRSGRPFEIGQTVYYKNGWNYDAMTVKELRPDYAVVVNDGKLLPEGMLTADPTENPNYVKNQKKSAPETEGMSLEEMRTFRTNLKNRADSQRVVDDRILSKIANLDKEIAKAERAERRAEEKTEEDAGLKKLFGELRSMRNRLSMGVDPEIAVIGTKIAVIYMKKGVRNFRDFAAGCRDNLGEDWDSFKKYLHSFWSGAMASNSDADFFDDLEDISFKDAKGIVDNLSEKAPNTDKENVNENATEPTTQHPGEDSSRSGEGTPVRAGGRGQRSGYDDSVLEGQSASDDSVSKKPGSPKTAGKNSGRKVDGGRERELDLFADNGRERTVGTELVSDGAGSPGDNNGGRSGRSGRNSKPSGTNGSETRLNQSNFRIRNPEALVGGGPKTKFARNRKAIEIYQALLGDNRAPTEAEREALASYIGWGSFGQELFNGSWDRPAPKEGWGKEDAWLREHLGKDEWQSAQRSIINAHYTDPPTVTAMWDMVERMGFKGGRILEPAMGIGNFFGLMPEHLSAKSELTGIELDQLTGGMAQMLYPQANIQIKGYEKSQTPDDFYDLIIGNWPFAAQSPADRRYNKLNPTLHDYFFLKAIDQVRPGGLVVGITSSGTMDKLGQRARLEMSKKADLVASFRLPTGAFGKYAGTAVVTDIIILKKHEGSELGAVPEWVNTTEIDTPAGEKIRVNKYYADNPGNVLGTLNYGHGTTRGRAGMIVDRPRGFEEKLTALPQQVPAGIYKPVQKKDSHRYVTNNSDERINSVTIGEDGNLYVVQGERMAWLEDTVRIKVKSEKTTKTRLDSIRELVEIRQTLGKLVDAQREGSADEEDLRKQLKKQYKAFVKERGHINDSYALKTLKRANDPNYAQLAALEHNAESSKNKAPRWIPATIMERSTMRRRPRAENLSIRDAYVFQRNESLDLDVEAIATLAKSTEAEVIEDLISTNAIYRTPQGGFEHSDIYLSGNVRMKLADAKAATEDGVVGMERNIAALEKVIPEDIPYFNIEAKMGNNWTGADVYGDFAAELLSANESERSRMDVSFGPQGWKVRLGDLNLKPEATSQWGTMDCRFDRIVQAAMNNTTIVIKRKGSDGKQVVDEKASGAANEKAQTLREHFSEWVWKDPERRVKLERAYNETFNSIALPSFNGDFLSFEGMMLERGDQLFNLRSHQSSAIARGLITGRGIYAHEVGTGKTYTMAGIAIESRRYGKARKPLIFAHNANSATVAREINEMYPGAKVLYVDKMEKKDRAVKLAQITNDDWDAVVVPHSMIDKFALRPETYEALAAEEIAELEAAAIDAADEDGVALDINAVSDDDAVKKIRSPRAKELVKSRNAIIERIQKMSQKSDEDAIRLEDAGVDMIIVDEAHEFKKPPVATKMQMRGLNTSSSDRSVNMMFLLNYIGGINGGKGVHLFTGTPITNTLNEIYNMMRFVMGDVMKRDGVDHWDAWFNTFADQNTDIEVTSTGEYAPVTRLSSFVNVPELRLMVGQYMDTVFADEMPEFEDRKTKSEKTLLDPNLTDAERNELENGRTEKANGRPYKLVKTVVAAMSPDQQQIRLELMRRARIFATASKKERKAMMKEGSPNVPIRVETDAANAGLDARMFDMELEDYTESKVNMALSNVMTHYRQHDKACQVIFMERGFSDFSKIKVGKNETMKVPRYNLAKGIVARLVELGIPEEQIAIVDGKMNKERRKQVADAMNTGEIRVVIGSTGTLGTGVNMQQNLRAMHHLDAPWRPGDLEQRNGRGHRQGNKWNSVIEYRYVTEGIDGRRWQVLVVKDKFIKEFLRSKGDKRVIEGDIADMDDGGGNDLTATLSEATGDPRILLMEKAKKDIERFQRRERMHTEGVAEAKRKIRYLDEGLLRRGRMLEGYQNDNAKLIEQAGNDFTVEIDGKHYSDRKKANEKLGALHTKLPIKHKQAPKRLGNFKGFEIFGQLNDLAFGKPEVEMYVAGTEKYYFRGSIAGMEAVLRNLPRKIEDMQKAITEDTRSIANLKKASVEPFAHAEKLEKAIRALDQIEKDLALNPVPPPAWLRQPTPIGSTILYDGKKRVVSGHMWNNAGWYVMIEAEEGFDAIPYMDVRDEQGAELYEEHEFEKPILVEEENEASPEEGDGEKFRSDIPFTTTKEDAIKRRSQTKEAISLIHKILGDKVNLELVTEKLMTPTGQRALGKYRQGWITLVKGGQMADTALHEAVHAAVDLFLSPEDKAALLDDVNGDEEALAENFVKYARDRSGFSAKVKRIAHKLLRVLRALVGRPTPPLDRVTKFYDDLLAGEFAGASQYASSGLEKFSLGKDSNIESTNLTAKDAARLLKAFGDPIEIDPAVKFASHKDARHAIAEILGNKRSRTNADTKWDISIGLNEVGGIFESLPSEYHGVLLKIPEIVERAVYDRKLDDRKLRRNVIYHRFLVQLTDGNQDAPVIMFVRENEKNHRKYYKVGMIRGAATPAAGRKSARTTNSEYNPSNQKNDTPLGAESQDKFRTEEQAGQFVQAKDAAMDWVKTFLAKIEDKNDRPDLSSADLILGTISHYKDKVPAIARLFDSAQRLRDNKHFCKENIFGEGEKDMGALREFERKNKQEWGTLNSYLLKRDMDAVGYAVQHNEEGGFDVKDPREKHVGTYEREGDAWNAAYISEARDYRAAGNSEAAASALLTYRKIAGRMYQQLLNQATELKEALDELHLPMPEVEDGLSVFDYLKQMGDRRGHYMPRMRQSGQWLLTATKAGENPRLETFPTRAQRKIRATTLQRDGYKVEFRKSDRPSEDSFLDVNMVAMNDMISNAMERLQDSDKNVNMDDFGIKYQTVTYTRKTDGKPEKHFILHYPEETRWNDIFKRFGGRAYDDEQTGTGHVWHFANPPADIQKLLARAMFEHEQGVLNPAEKFAEMFTKQVAEIIHSRGSRSRKIARNEATGKDVWVGYEENAMKALSMAGNGTASGTAKRQMAKEMMQIITGTDISWPEFRDQYLKEHDDVRSGDVSEMFKIWRKYQKMVSSRRVDSATQPNAYKEALGYSREMLRNEEPSERVFGAIKGVAALKYLSGIAPGVVNMTALLTTVPASMKAFGDIPVQKSAQLLKKGMGRYVSFYMKSRWGKGEGVSGEDEWLFNEISRRGWDEALMNDEAIKTLQNGLQRGWNETIDKALIVFSVTERINRGSTIAAAYYGLRAQGMNQDEALEQAKIISDKAHGVYGKENLPSWARGSDAGHQIARSFYMYKTFSHNYLQVLKEMIGKRDLKASAFMLMAPGILAGAGANVATPLLGMMVKGIFAAIPGLEPPDDPEEEFYLWAEATFGGGAGRFARTGLAGLVGVNLKGSLSIGISDLPTDLESLIGAPWSLGEDFITGSASLIRGDFVKGAEKLLPRVAASPLRGFREASEGVTSRNNQPLYYGDERLRASFTDAVLRSLSFNPAGISSKREEQWKERVVENRYRDMRTDIYAKMRRWALNDRSKGGWADILVDVEQYNARVRQSRFESIPFITESGIKTQMKKMNSLSKREKIRAGLVEREDPGSITVEPYGKKSLASRRSVGRSIKRSISR